MKKLEARAAAGAAYLDTVYPDWHRVVSVDRLDMSSGTQCILGQLYGVYGCGEYRILNSSYAMASKLGFHLGYINYNFRSRKSWQSLRLAWINEIAKRRVKDEAVVRRQRLRTSFAIAA